MRQPDGITVTCLLTTHSAFAAINLCMTQGEVAYHMYWCFGSAASPVVYYDGPLAYQWYIRVSSFFNRIDTYIMDTPGYSSIEVLCREEDEVADYFREFRPFLGTCRFTGCRHLSEPDCSVKAAVSEGTVSQERYESYKQIITDIMGKKKY